MIETGTKVIVLSSSCKKKTSPRRGSVGFVSKVRRYGPEISYIDGEDAFINLTKVIFTRYGFEHKERCESKFFLNVFPSYLSERKINEALLERHTKIMELNKAPTINRKLSEAYGKASVTATVGVLVPITTNNNVMELSDNEFTAWLTSFLYEHTFNVLIENAYSTNDKISKVVDHNVVSTLMHLSHSSSLRKELFPKIAGDKDQRQQTVDTIRRLIVIGASAAHRKRIKTVGDWFTNMRFRERGDLIEAGYVIAEDFYNNAESLCKIKLGAEKNGSSSLMEIYRRMRAVKDRLVCLGQALEEEERNEKEEEEDN